MLAGTITVVEAVPCEHGTVTGRPDTAVFLDENVQVTALSTVAVSVAAPPVDGTGDGLETKAEITGRAVIGEIVMLVVVVTFAPEPSAVRATVYVLARLLLLAATFTPTVAAPDVHGIVTGRPETVLFAFPRAEKVQVVAFATAVDSVTVPPVHDTGDGLAV